MGGDQHIAVEDGRERRHVRVVGTRGAGPSAKMLAGEVGALLRGLHKANAVAGRLAAGLPEERERIAANGKNRAVPCNTNEINVSHSGRAPQSERHPRRLLRARDLHVAEPRQRLAQRLLIFGHQPRHRVRGPVLQRREVFGRGIVPQRGERPDDLRQRPRREFFILHDCVPRENVQLLRAHAHVQQRRAPQPEHRRARVQRPLRGLLHQFVGQRRRVRTRRLMPRPSVRAEQLRRLVAVQLGLPRSRGVFALVLAPEVRGVRADHVVARVGPQHPPGVHHRQPVVHGKLIRQPPRGGDDLLHVARRRPVTKPRERPVRLDQHLRVHAIRQPRRRVRQRVHRVRAQGRAHRRERPEDAIHALRRQTRRASRQLGVHRLDVRLRRRDAHLGARPQALG
mmetsp:Transcript_7287/g.32138  ORF Transcript_7287/g.32138 Transcript_7287/m.32138 type:complete len:397 (+) Transcript_7287:494-1684(+)